jgi:hypothetical protein
MNKNTALWVLLGGAGLSVYDMVTTKPGANGGNLYGPGKPLENLRFEIYKTDAGKQYYMSVSDAAAVIGAWFYFV